MEKFLRLKNEEKLREETLEKYIKYTDENEIPFSIDGIITYDVSKPSRKSHFRRVFPSATHQFLRSLHFNKKRDIVKASLCLIPYLLLDIIAGLLIFAGYLLCCIPYKYVSNYLYFLSFYGDPNATHVVEYLRQNMIITNAGIFVYMTKVDAYYTFDVNYSPMINFIVWITFMEKNMFSSVFVKAENIYYINIQDVQYGKPYTDGFIENIFFVDYNGYIYFAITEEIKNIIDETKKKAMLEI
eukprot:snap_masked-scaffold_24-processed-gene-2.27-mRNA-1 protein AED:1.00 eAED:1.00 QI:0/-1/0/0/-1/1/1/0/241